MGEQIHRGEFDAKVVILANKSGQEYFWLVPMNFGLHLNFNLDFISFSCFFFIFRQNLLKRVQGNIDLSLPLTPLGAAEERKELGILPTSFLKSNLLYLYNKQGFSLESFIQLSGIVSSQGTIAGYTHIIRFFIFCPHLKLQFALRILMTLS